ncbi:MarR family winged helix-turn-helix transcriptional regulator [Marinicrinis lubricantis]|uniref:MarR family winged helix-turn-helix transcriptional regulator n=1 Tax=Marinicrinis lubricantis TaxID=2086470 RepID=A0ABW1ITW3_9BACL
MDSVHGSEDRELSLKLFVVLSKAYKVIMDHSAKSIKQHRLSQTEFAVLELLYHKGRIPLQQIGGKILVTSGSITYNIDKLEEKGYLKRVPCPNDRRVTFAEMTEEGTALLDRIFPQHAQMMQQVMKGLNEEEKKTAIELIKKLGLHAENS